MEPRGLKTEKVKLTIEDGKTEKVKLNPDGGKITTKGLNPRVRN
jgi:hypothetical protein